LVPGVLPDSRGAVAVTVNVYVPALDGVPENKPLEDRFKPGGSEPAEIDHES
jgi:hypothetical protein